MKAQILKNIFSKYLLSFLGMGLGVLLVPFLIHKLGKDGFGISILAESIIAFFEIVTLSVRQALARYATFSLSKGDNEQLVQYLSTGRYLSFFCAGVVLIGAGTLSFFFPQIFTVPAGLENDSRILFFLITLGFTITIPNIVYWSVLYAKQRMDIINLASSIGLIVRALGIFILFSFLPGKYVSLAAYGAIYFLMRFFENYAVYWWHKKLMPGLRLSVKDFKADKVRDLFSFGIHTSLSRVSSLLYENTANVLINIFWGPAMNSLYAVSLKFPKLLSRVFRESAWTLSPTFTDLAAKGDTGRFARLYFMYTKIATIVVTPFSLLLIFWAGPLIRLWVGEGFEKAIPLFQISMVAQMLTIPLAIASAPLSAYAKVKIPSQVSFLTAVLNVIIGIWLARYMSWGLMGIASAAALFQIFYGGVFVPFYASRISGISFRKYMTESFLYPFAWTAFFMACAFALIQVFQKDDSLTVWMLGAASLAIVLHFLISYKLLLKADEQNHVMDIFKVKRKLTPISQMATGKL